MPRMSANVNPMLRDKMVFVCAVNHEGYIGKDGKMIWANQHDRLRFNRLTTGHTVVYGGGLYRAMGQKPLADRINIVVSRTLPMDTPGIKVVRKIGEVKQAYEAHGENLLFVIGGGQIFKELHDQADVVLMTSIEDNTIGDTELGFKLDPAKWTLSTTLAISKIDKQDELLKEVKDELAAASQGLKGDCTEANLDRWFYKRVLPIFQAWRQDKDNLAGEKLSRKQITDMHEVSQKIGSLPAPFVRGVAPERVTDDYLIQVVFRNADPSLLLRMRLYGFEEASQNLEKAVLHMEKRLIDVFENPERRVLSHTYLTLQRKSTLQKVE